MTELSLSTTKQQQSVSLSFSLPLFTKHQSRVVVKKREEARQVNLHNRLPAAAAAAAAAAGQAKKQRSPAPIAIRVSSEKRWKERDRECEGRV